MSKKLKNKPSRPMEKLASAIAKREGKKVQVSIGNIREVLNVLVGLEVEWYLSDGTFGLQTTDVLITELNKRIAVAERAKKTLERNKPTVVVHGPAGIGKSRDSEKLRQAFGVARVIDGWSGRTNLPKKGALVLSNDVGNAEKQGLRSFTYREAMKMFVKRGRA